MHCQPGHTAQGDRAARRLRAALDRARHQDRRRSSSARKENPDDPHHSTTKDVENLTLTMVAEFDASNGAGLGGLGGPAQARAVVGPADVPGDLHSPRVRRRRPVALLHDRARGRDSAGWWRIDVIEKPSQDRVRQRLSRRRRRADGRSCQPSRVDFELERRRRHAHDRASPASSTPNRWSACSRWACRKA